ncbi:hypothetical protein CEP52_016838 [Fusarium oligoseptatum]|uniref:Uncharacterized protein n=1 Tax=Fusarium oligoseptatum TaxID=2604345 RepID=A0A428RZE8_9HYPO|nr:hypothetical protein CEP52_016838 [Fusarium oligoseptatum]
MVFRDILPDEAEVIELNETTPWLQHTRWPELFRNRPLDIIAASAWQPGPVRGEDYLLGQWKGTSFWSSADAEARLRILIQGVDLMFDRATATLALWKRFIRFIFRVLRFKARQRQKIYNLRLGSDEEKMMQYILTLVAQLLLEGGGCDPDRLDQEDLAPINDCNQEYREADDDDDSETDEDADYEEEEHLEEEHIEEEHYPMGDESDFVPPSGSWLQLSEALFQLSMMFWTHRDPAGNMASSVLIYYTAVMGIQRESLAYHSANNSTPGLAALIWVGRVLFLDSQVGYLVEAPR